MTHPTDLELDAYAADLAGQGSNAVAAHIDGCATCRGHVEEARELLQFARDPEVRDLADAMRAAGRPPRLNEALARKAEIEAENLLAARRLAPLLKSRSRFLAARVSSKRVFHSAGAVRMLCGEAHARENQSPKFSLELAMQAYEIAKQLQLPAQAKNLLLGMALRQQASAARYLLPLKEVLRQLDGAAKFFSGSSPSEAPFELAMVDYLRAVVLVQLDETTEEALRISRRALAVFQDYADERRELHAALAEATALHYLADTAEAITAYHAVISAARRLQEKVILGYALKNAGIAHRQLNRLDEAEFLHAEAEALFDELHIEAEKIQIEWEFALIAVRRGDLVRGAAALGACRRALLKMGLKNDSALATLDWAEVRLQMGEPTGVAKACRAIIMQFESEGMGQKAAVALDYVNRALSAGRAKPPLIREVREYLARLPRRPNLAFAPAT